MHRRPRPDNGRQYCCQADDSPSRDRAPAVLLAVARSRFELVAEKVDGFAVVELVEAQLGGEPVPHGL
jgi:hypothetical protein